MLDRAKWLSVLPTWNKAAAFVVAVASRGFQCRKVDPAVKAVRWQSCHGGPCPNRAYSAEKKFHYCAACGCGERELARLSRVGSAENDPQPDIDYDKLDYPLLQCPIGAAGFSNAKD